MSIKVGLEVHNEVIVKFLYTTNFEVLKLQFVALSSPYLRCYREDRHAVLPR